MMLSEKHVYKMLVVHRTAMFLNVVLGVDMAEETNAILFEPDGSRARLIIREL